MILYMNNYWMFLEREDSFPLTYTTHLNLKMHHAQTAVVIAILRMSQRMNFAAAQLQATMTELVWT